MKKKQAESGEHPLQGQTKKPAKPRHERLVELDKVVIDVVITATFYTGNHDNGQDIDTAIEDALHALQQVGRATVTSRTVYGVPKETLP
jgi:predicted secreted protein